MSDSEWDDLKAFNSKFNFPQADEPRHLTTAKLKERINFIREELQELESACLAQDLVEQADALVDLVYVIKGTALMLGLPWSKLWREVHRSNMVKERGMTKRGLAFDCVKPAGWKPPLIAKILKDAGYDKNIYFNNRDFIEELAHGDN